MSIIQFHPKATKKRARKTCGSNLSLHWAGFKVPRRADLGSPNPITVPPRLFFFAWQDYIHIIQYMGPVLDLRVPGISLGRWTNVGSPATDLRTTGSSHHRCDHVAVIKMSIQINVLVNNHSARHRNLIKNAFKFN